MVLQSSVPRSISAPRRLREYLKLVRELSLQRSANDLLNAYRARVQFVVSFDHSVSLSRMALAGPRTRITRSTRWQESINPWKERDKLPLIDSGLFVRLMDAGVPVKMDQIEVEPDDPAAAYLDGMNSLLASPIFHDGVPSHMVIVLRSEPASFTLEELSTFVLTSNLVGHTTSQLVLADQLRAAYAALDREFRIVGEIQRQLLPAQVPAIPGVGIATHYETSTRAGGDYYDFFPHQDGLWGILIADVSGHGTPAAVVMAMMHALMNAPLHTCPRNVESPTDVLTNLNARLIRSLRPAQFATAFYGLLDPRSRTLRYASAGHNPPRRLRRADGSIVALESESGLPLAINDDFHCDETLLQLDPGDRLLLYTDGVTETFNPQGDMFGTQRLDASLRTCRATADSVVECVKSSMHNFAAGLPPADDRTLVALAFD